MSFDREQSSNLSANKHLIELLESRITRRQLLKGGLAVFAASLPFGGQAANPGNRLNALFARVAASTADAVVVPDGYTVSALYRWGDEVGIAGARSAPWREDASNSADEQALQAGMHHDGIHYFPLPHGSANSTHGLLVINHEYTDDGLLHPDGMQSWSAEKVCKAQMAHGVSVIEVKLIGAEWRIIRPSRFARRITARTPIAISGAAAASDLLRTIADPSGKNVLGTINNCANGATPWGTFLTCEENFNYYFDHAGKPANDEARYGMRKGGLGFRWHEFDERFDTQKHPNEPNRFGWVVEMNPYDPNSTPVKRTALGRFKHEGAVVTLAVDGRVVVYMGDDELFEYIYKFVSKDKFNPKDRAANRHLLDQGTLYVARFDEGGKGRWIALEHGGAGLNPEAGFRNQGDVLIKTRQAADIAGATKMDRPEWIAVHPATQEVYVALTNNKSRGGDSKPGGDAANPRVENVFGHIVRWRERDGNASAMEFSWDIFVLAGDPVHADSVKRGNIGGDAFGSPDGLWFDGRGLLWIQTDVSTAALNKGDYARLGNNQMLAADVRTGEIRRFLTGPANCEVTGISETPDGKNFFVNIQHPGETALERSDPANPRAISNWPDFNANGRPRSATIVIRHKDSGIVGT